ncbi:MAG: 50S ribosomal protein L10 [Paludibacter sp.]|jgi:large subunit ribosomal protein L10|nr:50S ribosomal protein L10 [Bacteroidales bacterium]HOG05929.1 50S ribosomal protein L10 [Paludibacter sp.]HOS45554.1 50S ribosomal protein L10 [Paludibacter sp.]HPM09453.1 50S ribosomal protein L10 [Paludibacter sp.]
MKKEDKSVIIKQIESAIQSYAHFYLTDIGGLNAEETSNLRRTCFKQDVKLLVVKNTLLKKALESSEVDYSELFGVLKGETSLMLSNTGNAPARLIKDFSRNSKSKKPVLKAAYVEESFYIGENQLETLVTIKSKNELIGDIIALLQSPVKNVVSALQSGGTTIHGVLQTLSEK